jgi:hypothetical protein
MIRSRRDALGRASPAVSPSHAVFYRSEDAGKLLSIRRAGFELAG